MQKRIIIAICLCGTTLLSCGRKPSIKDSSTTDSTAAPVETKKPNAEYEPAFKGQTRAPGIHTKAEYRVDVLTEELNSPWGIKALPDGRLLITEKEGVMRIAKTDGSLSAPITGIPEVNTNGQGGLLGVTIDPNFASNRMIYWTFAENFDKGTLTAAAKGRLSDDETKIENAQVIYRATPAYDGNLHYGGRILFDAKGNLFLSTGERSDLVTRPQAQQLNSSLGKIIYITKDGNPVPGNPLASEAGAKPELFTYGHRNVQGLALHPETGDLWENEFGPRGGDEVNHIMAGKNYGWPTITYGIEYSGKKVGTAIQQKDGLEQPRYYWDPSVSPSGMTFFAGNSIPEWKNNLFIGALSGMHIVRLVIEDNKIVGEERLLEDQFQRFRDITQGKDGALYAITDQGRLYRVGK